MSSLRTCIRRAGKALPKSDADAIRAIQADLSGPNAALAAVDEYIEELRDERAELMDEVEAQLAFESEPPRDEDGNLIVTEASAAEYRAEMAELAARPITIDDFDFDPKLPAAAQVQERAFAEAIIARDFLTDIVPEYEKITKDNTPEETQGGFINSVDSWRELDPAYRNDRSTSNAVHEVSSALSKKYYALKLSQPIQGEIWHEFVAFTSGGTGVGKSSGLRNSAQLMPYTIMIFDGNLAKTGSAIRKIDQAILSGRSVFINHVIRDAIEAFEFGAMTRAIKQETLYGSGRPIPIRAHAGTSSGAPDTYRDLGPHDPDGHYEVEPNVFGSITDNRFGRGGQRHNQPLDSLLNIRDTKLLEAQLRSKLDEIYEHGIHQDNGTHSALSTDSYYGSTEEARPEGLGRYHPNFNPGGIYAAVGTRQDVERESAQNRRELLSRSGRVGDGGQNLKQAELQLALAPAIRALIGSVRVNIVQTAADLPGDAVPTDVEGMWRGGDEVWLVADNLGTAERAKKVLAHEAFGHLAMEDQPEFAELLASIRNLLAQGNTTITQVAEKVAHTQGNLDETRQAKEILAVMVEDDVQNGAVGRAIAAVRQMLRRMGLLDGANYSESEIKALLLRAARDTVSDAAAKQQALAAMPAQAQILEDPRTVESALHLAIKEIYANAVLQDMTLRVYTEAQGLEGNPDPAAQQRLKELKGALYRAEIAPRVGPEVLDPEALYSIAYHGTGSMFDRFDINFIGSGEGFQAFGWGLYFSSHRGVAEWYKKKLGQPEYTFRGKRATRGQAETNIAKAVLKATKRHAPKDTKASPGSNPAIAAKMIASGLISMVNRARTAGAQEVKDEIRNVINSLDNLATEMQGQDGFAESIGAKPPKTSFSQIAQKYRMEAEGWEAAFKIVDDGEVFYEGEQGNLMEVEVPDNDDLMHYEDLITEHSPEIQDKLKAAYPELFEEQWIDVNGSPLIERHFKAAGMKVDMSDENMAKLAFDRGVPADEMIGERLYNYIGEQEINASQTIVARLMPGFAGAIGQQVRDKMASKKLDALGIPGHSFIGTTSDELNYVMYDDSQIQMRAINDQNVPVVAEKIDDLFSRAGVVSETPGQLAEPGKPFLAYRFGRGSDSLENRNAGNAASVARRLSVFDDWESPQSGNQDADTVSVYEVVADRFTKYAAMNRGMTDADVDAGVGRYTAGPSQTNPDYQEVSYSFGAEGYTAKKVAELPLNELREKLQAQVGYSSFDMSGSAAGAQLLQDETPLFSRAPAVDTPAFKQWFGDSKIVDENGDPKVVFHGTKAEDFEAFRAKYDDDLIFFTTDAKFASKWLEGTGGLRTPPADTAPHIKQARDTERRLSKEIMGDTDAYDYNKPEDLERWEANRQLIRKMMKAETGFETSSQLQDIVGTRVIPVYLSIEKPFDPRRDWTEIESFLVSLDNLPNISGMAEIVANGNHKAGNWVVYEKKEVIDEIRSRGYDGIYLAENIGGPHDTIAAFGPEQAKSATGNRGTFDATDQNMMFSRTGQYLQIDDKIRNQPPQIAAQDALPQGEESGLYWALASDAGTRAFAEPKGSWEERYYTEIGRQASQAAKQPSAMEPSPTDQMALFSRMNRREFLQGAAAVAVAAATPVITPAMVEAAAPVSVPAAGKAAGKMISAVRFTIDDRLFETRTWNAPDGNSLGTIHELRLDLLNADPATEMWPPDSMPAYQFKGRTFDEIKGQAMELMAHNLGVETVKRQHPNYFEDEQREGEVDDDGRILGSTDKRISRRAMYSRSLMKVKRQNSEGDEFGRAIDVLKNPTLQELKAFSSNILEMPQPSRDDSWNKDRYGLRWYVDEWRDYYFWDAADSTHWPVLRGLALRDTADGADTDMTGYLEGASEDIISKEEIASGELRGYQPVDAQPPGQQFKTPAPRPMFSRYIHPDATMEQLRAKVLSPALEDITIKDRMRAVVERVKGIELLGIKQGIIDSAASVEELEKGIFGQLLDASESAYKSILSTRNLGSVMAAIMHRGIPAYQNGVFRPRAGRKGLIDIFQKITHHKDGNLLPLWELYAAAKRAQRLIQEKNPDGTLKEKNFTQADINKALTLETQYPEFKTAFMEWQKFNSQLLDLAIKRGVINGDEAKIWRQNDYVPFYRAMEELQYEGGQGPRGHGEGIANVRPNIRRLSGSEAPIGNVFENMVMNTSYLIDQIYRNTAMQRVVAMADGIAMTKLPMAWQAMKFKDVDIARALMKAGLIVGRGSTEADMINDGIQQVKAMTAAQKEHWSTMFRRVAPTGPNVVSVLLEGKPAYYEVTDPLLLRSIGAMGASQFGGVMNMFRLAKRTLTKAVTIDPAFMMANFIRDTLSSSVVLKGSGAKQVIGAMQGLKAAWAEDEDVLDMMMAGAGGGGFYDHNPADVRKMLAKKMPEGEINAFMNSVLTPRGLWRFWQKVGNASEQANRIAIYKRVIAEGGTPAEAAHQARDVLNFTMSGDYAAMAMIVQSVPFINARIQGLYRLYRGGKENPAGFAMKGLTITAATLVLLLKNRDDERYQALPEWDKDTYWHFFIGDEHFRLPKPFEVGAIFATVPERMIALGTGDDDLDMTIERGIRMLADTFAFNPIPQAIKPIQEQYSNRNMFTGNPIVGMALEGLEPEAQYDPWTSETMREMAKILPGWAGSPKRLEAFIRGYFGTVGMYALTASDAVTRKAFGHPDRPTKDLRNYPVLTRFWRDPNPRTSKYASELYDMMREADSLYKTMNAYRDQRRVGEAAAMMKDNRGKLAARAFLHDVASDVRKVNAKIRRVQFSDMAPERKKELIDNLNQTKLKLMARVSRVSDIF